MTIIESVTFVVLALATLLGTWRLRRRHRLNEDAAGRDPSSGSFASAAASTLLALKFDPLVGAHSIIYMPVGDGLYMSRTSSRKARAWRKVLNDWLSRGATINVIVTAPNASAGKAWRAFEAQHGNFHYFVLDRQQAPADLAREIESLDTYHPILLVSSPGAGAPEAMWIEQYHPMDSPYAYAVQYVAPSEVKADERFGVFLALYRRLLHGRHVRAGTQLQGEIRKAA
jgi:hypothetical protein